ncbi:helix-turn-helix domain-containing protein [Trinickia dinghuensis]|uniref:Helix-turn-helix domain-containing protein n=1 Tax=Trinickia dinghuensis TaxID=2291023 RepID=A0A3D8K1D0_9BURK|nr:helix-turn-helix domain-containing protein [Trinickia dinghuensis]RDU99108.1 helix-turn-helix domain-containing protein [Trinickia dinghuensis]
MYLYNAGGLRAAAKGHYSAGHQPDSTRDGAGARTEAGCHIGVVISDECSSSDVANVLARTCERFGAEMGGSNRVGKISITIIAGRSGFVLRENACLPVWCEAIYDVDPLDFQYFVVPESGSGTLEPRPEIVSWLARAGGGAKIIRLSLEASSGGDASEQAAREPREARAPRRSETPEANRHAAWQEEVNGTRPASEAQSEQTRLGVHAVTSFDKPTPSERIQATVEWLNQNYGSRIPISSMAEHALMSERNFLRRFRAEMGHTPHDYLSKIRLEHACKLLLTTALPVDKIARHCGLFNGDHLRKHFVKQFGVSPVEYRTARFKALQSQAGADADE